MIRSPDPSRGNDATPPADPVGDPRTGPDRVRLGHRPVSVGLGTGSHGCIRIPMDIAAFFHTLVPAPGTPVYVRG
jgi:hypothetical protein